MTDLILVLGVACVCIGIFLLITGNLELFFYIVAAAVVIPIFVTGTLYFWGAYVLYLLGIPLLICIWLFRDITKTVVNDLRRRQ